MHALVTMRDLLGVKVTAVLRACKDAAAGETWVANKPGGLNVRNSDDLENSSRIKSLGGATSGKPTHRVSWGRPLMQGKKQVKAPYNPTGSWLKHPGKDLQNKVGKNQFPAGARSNLQRPREISVGTRIPEERAGLAHELVEAMKKG
jgi:hypothetical protein